jgi:predicted NAD/FAD-binding protein
MRAPHIQFTAEGNHLKIAIIGAGVSGLAAALYLKRAGQTVVVFDKAGEVGGNAHTAGLNLGQSTRWADLGVNDFNATTYPNLVKLLNEFRVGYKPLEDTCSFSTQDGSVSYTLDERWNTPMPAGISQEYDRFQKTAPEVLTDPKYKDYTVARYLAEKGYSQDFGRYNIYPRINGMYFAHDTTPETMPIRGVMHYYTLQEGFGTKEEPRRMYFTDGSSSWLKALATASGATIVLNEEVKVYASSQNVQVRGRTGQDNFDAVLFACHANIAQRTLQAGLTGEMASVLGAFDYCSSVGVAHNYSPLLPADKNAWRTYNILIHDNYAQLRPYTISYVENLHQNDPQNPPYNHFSEPYFFVTLNPSIAIPDRNVLRSPQGQKAIAYFPHNVFNLDAIAAQEKIPTIQGQNNVYFTGGWTHGAGLQEECLLSAQDVTKLILQGKVEKPHTYNLAAGPEEYAPQYIRDVLAEQS